MATLDDIYPPKLDFGRVFQRTAWVLGRQPLLIFGLALVLGALPTALSLYSIGHWADFDDSPFSIFHSGYFWGPSLLALIVAAFLEAAVLAAALGELGGRSPTPPAALTAGLKFFLPLFAVNLIFVLCVAAGLILLVVPGVILALAWCLAGPALLVERSGITEVFGRSADLTRNNRWRLFGLALIYAVINSIIDGPSHAHPFHYGWAVFPDVFTPVQIGFRAVFGSALHVIGLTTLAVVYAELRAVKEGAEPADLDQVLT